MCYYYYKWLICYRRPVLKYCSKLLLALVLVSTVQAKNYHVVTTQNVGYQQSQLPVKITHCLDRIAVPQQETTIHHGSAAEPTIAVNPKNPCNIVASWQQDRLNNGGGLDLGIGYSFDAGNTWHRTEIPFQICSGGSFQRATDVWLSFAADGSKVYLCAIVFNRTTQVGMQTQQSVIVCFSTNGGKSWSTPTLLSPTRFTLEQPHFPTDDKNSITADPNTKTHAYAVWSRYPNLAAFHSNALISRTTDSGMTWSKPRILYNPYPDLCATGLSNCIKNNNQITDNVVVVLPKAKPGSKEWYQDKSVDSTKLKRLSGDVLNFATRVYATPAATNKEFLTDVWPSKFTLIDTVLIRSKDQGVTWDTTATIVIPSPQPNITNPRVFTGGYSYNSDGSVAGGIGTLLRASNTLPSFNVNPTNGFLYTVLMTSTLRKDFFPQIGITTSRDGGYTWSPVIRANRTPQNCPNPQAFTPFVTVTRDGYVGILYNDFRNDTKANPHRTNTDAWLAIYKEVQDPQGGSTGIGLQFVKEIRLSKESYIVQNGPTTTQGVMTNGDYSFLTAVHNRFYAIYTKPHFKPFSKPILFFEDPEKKEQLFIDDNYRQSPYVSIISPCSRS